MASDDGKLNLLLKTSKISGNRDVANNYYRPDLKKAALARLSAVNRSLRVAKSGVKKRNRQAVKIVD
ncbi:hypothetical protein JHK87_050651 [Glycine soja]|nr:hypothetical protein JHK87_050651 [Glycine soja]